MLAEVVAEYSRTRLANHGKLESHEKEIAGCCLVRAERPTSDPTENQIACSRAETTRATQDQNWEPESVGGGGKIDPGVWTSGIESRTEQPPPTMEYLSRKSASGLSRRTN
jgi:hypothetical protein